jgi:hypothetical protein
MTLVEAGQQPSDALGIMAQECLRRCLGAAIEGIDRTHSQSMRRHPQRSRL